MRIIRFIRLLLIFSGKDNTKASQQLCCEAQIVLVGKGNLG